MPRRSRRPSPVAPEAAVPEQPGAWEEVFRKVEPWLPWAVAGVFLAVMGFLTFRYHTVGGLGVETDFYAELYPQARQLVEGDFSPLNYGAKGPVYSFLLAGTWVFVRDFFQAGLVLNLLAAAGFLIALFFLVRRVFNSLTAAVALPAVALNPLFLNYSYQAGSDMPFLLLCALSLLFLFRDGGKRDLALSALFGLLAFLTRYNGAFIAAGAMLFFALSGGSWKDRRNRAGLWLGVFLAAGLPWFISNWIATGSPVKNDNYVNVMMEFYALGKGAGYENWTDALPKQFTGMADIFFYDPVYFVRHLTANIGTHFIRDLGELTGWVTGVFVVLGMALLTFIRPVRVRLLYFAFGMFYFLILALVFYNTRFSLFLLTMYLPLAVWPLTVRITPRYMQHAFRFLLMVFVGMTLAGAVKNSGLVYAEIRQSPTFLRDLGTELARIEPDHAQKIMARKPHVAYYAGLTPAMFPEKPRTVEELIVHSREQGIRYILYTAIEAQVRPNFQPVFLDLNSPKPGLKLVYYNRFGVIYRVE